MVSGMSRPLSPRGVRRGRPPLLLVVWSLSSLLFLFRCASTEAFALTPTTCRTTRSRKQHQRHFLLPQLSAFGGGGDNRGAYDNYQQYQYNDPPGYQGGIEGGEYDDDDDGLLLAERWQEYHSEQLLDQISIFCIGTQEFWKSLIAPPLRSALDVRLAGTAGSDPVSKIKAGPELPGLPRPVWLTILGSIPTAFSWYGYYKFSIEEELYYSELKTTGRVTSCGGYGSLVPPLYGVLIGGHMIYFHAPGGDVFVFAALIWTLLGQMNMYRRVNELTQEARDELGLDGDGRMLHEWWALLPVMNLVVGLRSVHFLSEYWRVARGLPPPKDYIAEDLFPFIAARWRFSLRQFLTNPSLWFWFTRGKGGINLPDVPMLNSVLRDDDDDDRFNY